MVRAGSGMEVNLLIIHGARLADEDGGAVQNDPERIRVNEEGKEETERPGSGELSA